MLGMFRKQKMRTTFTLTESYSIISNKKKTDCPFTNEFFNKGYVNKIWLQLLL